ncbi:MAG: DegV family protein, partial [Candidatus Saccharibacteria bacterium]
IADNCCDLPEDILKQYNIKLVHALVRFGDYEYPPGKPSIADFYEIMKSSSIMPTTSQPSPEEMKEVFTSSLEDGSEVIAIHMSSGISGTYQGSVLVKDLIDNPRLHLVDSKKASLGMGLLVLEAAKMANRGEQAGAILSRLADMQNRLQCIFFVGNLEYLIKGGRISRAKGLVAGILDIKPILRFDTDGYIVAYEKVRGHKAALHRLMEITEKMGVNLTQQTMGVVHSACTDDAEYLRKALEDKFSPSEIIMSEIGPVVGSHVGPGSFSVFFESDHL